MHRHLMPWFVVALSLLASGAAAQEKGKKGVTLGYPASIGLIWHVTDRIAIRPEFSFAFTSNEVVTTPASLLPGVSGTGVRTDTDTTALAVGVSGLYYLTKATSLSAYVSPRFVYTRTRTTTEASTDLLGSSFVNGSSYAVSGVYGVQYAPIPNINLFGEAGIGFTETNNSSTLSVLSGHQFSTRGGVGMIVYF